MTPGLSSYLNIWSINQSEKVGYAVAEDFSSRGSVAILRRLEVGMRIPKEELDNLRKKQLAEFEKLIDKPKHTMKGLNTLNEKHRKQLLRLHNKWLKKEKRKEIQTGQEKQEQKDTQ